MTAKDPGAARQPKHRAIYEVLQREIATGAYPDGRLPTEADLVRRFAASRPTVARALDALRQQGLIERRAGQGTFLRAGSRADPAPAKTALLGLIGSGLGHTEILRPIAAEIARSAETHGHRLVLGDAGQAETRAQALAEEFLARGVAGVFLAPLETLDGRAARNGRLLAAFLAARVPVVLLDRDLNEFPARSDLDLVAIDDFRAGFQAAAHLARQGCKRLAFVARPHYPSTTDLRLAGCREAGLRLRCAVVPHIGEPRDAAFANAILKDRCDGAVCANDRTAADLVRALPGKVPAALRVVGFDDVAAAADSPVPLTTMRLPCRELGRTAVHIMRERLRGAELPPLQVLLTATLVRRKSA
jgi:LacI family transcriptional regulator